MQSVSSTQSGSSLKRWLSLALIAGALSTLLLPASLAGAQEGELLARDERPVVYLTFDDGPSVHTDNYLDLLARYDAKATFFVLGPGLLHRPALSQRIVDEGHAVGNHTWSHPNLAISSDERIRSELGRSQEAFEEVLGFRPTCFRPPFGATSPRVYDIQLEFGLTNSAWQPARNGAYQVGRVSPHAGTWDVDTADYKRSTSLVASQLANIRANDVVLMHDLHSVSLGPLSSWLERNHDRFRFEALPGCIPGDDTWPLPTAVDYEPPLCEGREATIVGTSGSDVLFGTRGDDVIVAFDGDDTIMGFGGDDVICAGEGADHIDSGRGHDEVHGEGGSDYIATGKGRDTVLGGSGSDEIHSGNGVDNVAGGADADVIFAGNGDDAIAGNRGSDVLRGNRGDDELVGGHGEDELIGGVGDDVLDGVAELDPAPEAVTMVDGQPVLEDEPEESAESDDGDASQGDAAGVV